MSSGPCRLVDIHVPPAGSFGRAMFDVTYNFKTVTLGKKRVRMNPDTMVIENNGAPYVPTWNDIVSEHWMTEEDR